MKILFASVFVLTASLLFAADLGFKEYSKEEYWLARDSYPPVTKEALERAVELGRGYFINSQKSDGNFIYLLDLSNGETLHKDNAVRQAGALWALCSLARERYNEPTGRAARLGIDFFAKNVRSFANGTQCTVYPDTTMIQTGMVALFSLSLIEYLRGQGEYMDADTRMRYQGLLDAHLNYLKSMELPNGSWASHFETKLSLRGIRTSPYYDGETLLAYIKAAKYMGRSDLIPRINMALPILVKRYTLECWKPGGDPDLSKGFCQWGMMSMDEYYSTDWNEHDSFIKDASLSYAWWLIHETSLERKNGNTGYSLEGLIGVYNIQKSSGNKVNADKIRGVIERVMSRLLTLQCASPLASHNGALSSISKLPEGAEGGIISSDFEPTVRIDTHQHQMHAMLMMLKMY